MLRIAQGHFEILKRRRSSATFKITADMSRKRFLNQPNISSPFDLFSSFDNKQQHQLQLERFHIQTEKNMSSKLLIVLCLMASSTRSRKLQLKFVHTCPEVYLTFIYQKNLRIRNSWEILPKCKLLLRRPQARQMLTDSYLTGRNQERIPLNS